MGLLNRKSALAVGLAIVMAAVQLLYWTSAIFTADRYIIDFEGLMWRTSPPGSLFPVPTGSGMLQALSPVSETDQVVYSMINSGLYILLSVALTLAAGVAGYLLGVTISR